MNVFDAVEVIRVKQLTAGLLMVVNLDEALIGGYFLAVLPLLAVESVLV